MKKPNHKNTGISFAQARRNERGVAILTVLALLTVFGLILFSYTYTLKLEQLATDTYSRSAQVEELSDAAKEGGRSQLEMLDAPISERTVLGKRSPRYVSLVDPALQGFALNMGTNSSLDARTSQLRLSSNSRQVATNIIPRQGGGQTYLPLRAAGIDEDPPGDASAVGNERLYPNYKGDDAPGIAGIDDDFDQQIDEGETNDDDEDDLVDEDGIDRYFDGGTIPPGLGFDSDLDARGVFDESGKIDLNWAGNLSKNGKYSVGEGVTSFELDLPVFLQAVLGAVEYGHQSPSISGENLAKAIVQYRQGDNGSPGSNDDDDGDGESGILKSVDLDEAFNGISTIDSIPAVVVGDGKDNNGNGLIDDETEVYIGPSLKSSTVLQIDDAIGLNLAEGEQAKDYLPGDRIDNNGDGIVDEKDEGTNEPDEFNPLRPSDDDTPLVTLEDLKQLSAFSSTTEADTVVRRLTHLATIFGEADQVSLALSGPESDFLRINPNLANTWTAQLTEEDRAEYSVSPPLAIEALFRLHVDNDGDWQAETEGPGSSLDLDGDGQAGNEVQFDGKDNDGDGLIDEPSDDWDGNQFPSADFDGHREVDQAALAFASDGRDSDGDGSQNDVNPQVDQILKGGLIRMGEVNGPEIEVGERIRSPRQESDLLTGFTREGNGRDTDGDRIADDNGDFNGDSFATYDPEWHLNEDPEGDGTGEGLPGLGGPDPDEDPQAPDYILDIVDDQDLSAYRFGAEKTSFADDDGDGFADLKDPQVIAAMFRPERDGVDNDSDGFVDEPGELYIAAFDDDEDGRMDEDPPEFQFIVNLMDYIDQFRAMPVTDDEDVLSEINQTEGNFVLADPVTEHVFYTGLTSSRQRALNMHPKSFSGAAGGAGVQFQEDTRMMLPNPPAMTNPTRYRGTEAVRINEVMAKPMIRLEAEEAVSMSGMIGADGSLRTGFDLSNGTTFSIDQQGIDDDGSSGKAVQGAGVGGADLEIFDTHWGATDNTDFYYRGFTGTEHPLFPNYLGTFDPLAPNTIFKVTNIKPPDDAEQPELGQYAEVASWTFHNIPPGEYDFALFLHPFHKLEPEVRYVFNNQPILLRSDTQLLVNESGNTLTLGDDDADLSDPESDTKALAAYYDPFMDAHALAGTAAEAIDAREVTVFNLAGFMPQLPPNYVGTSQTGSLTLGSLQGYNTRGISADITSTFGKQHRHELLLPYRLTPRYPNDSLSRITVGDDGVLTVQIVALRVNKLNSSREYYSTSFDRIELIDMTRQFVELVNISPDDIDLYGWTVETPYGKYVIKPNQGNGEVVLPRIKPLFVGDDGDVVTDGYPAGFAPYEHQLLRRSGDGSYSDSLTSSQVRREDNSIVLVPDRASFLTHLQNDYPDVDSARVPTLADRVIQLEQTAAQAFSTQRSDVGTSYNPIQSIPYADTRFKVVDREEDILSDNREEKYIRLYDPAGNLIDEFRYETTFNNLVVHISGNYVNYLRDTMINSESIKDGTYTIDRGLDIIAVPGYRGMESAERADPTEVISEQRVNFKGPMHTSVFEDDELYSDRYTPTYRLLARDAVIEPVYSTDGIYLPGGREGQSTLFITDTSEGFGFEDVPGESKTNIPQGVLTAGSDRTSVDRPPQGGWDFVGDAPDQGRIRKSAESSKDNVPRLPEVGPFASGPNSDLGIEETEWPEEGDEGSPLLDKQYRMKYRQALFFSGVGGFENYQNRVNVTAAVADNARSVKGDIVSFTWRLGLRELVRAGFDPDVDDTINIRVFGRNHVVNVVRALNQQGIVGGAANMNFYTDIPMPVGEVAIANAYAPRSFGFTEFAKLRNGDSAGSVCLGDLLVDSNVSNFQGYDDDLNGQSGDEPIVELKLYLRKTVTDYSAYTTGIDPLIDNYYFHHIEISGRGRNTSVPEARRALIAGTPLRDNTGYIPASARRRFMIRSTSQRDENDIIDNTPFVKNGRLASLGEISRIMTGKHFETVNSPLISQRLEDLSVTINDQIRQTSVPDLARLAGSGQGSVEERRTLAQLERLDQYENQYNMLYNMITTMPGITTGGLININTAPREVLMALPATPLSEGDAPEIEDVLTRMVFNSVVADYILEGRRPEGHDGGFGVFGVDDDNDSTGEVDGFDEYRLWTTGRSNQYWKTLDDTSIRTIMSNSTIGPKYVDGSAGVNASDLVATTIVSRPDDGPYEDIGRLLGEFAHLGRRERFSAMLSRPVDRTYDNKRDGIGDLRERLNTANLHGGLSDPLTPEDMERLMQRLSNLITVRSRAFSIITRGRTFSDGDLAAERQIETVYRN